MKLDNELNMNKKRNNNNNKLFQNNEANARQNFKLVHGDPTFIENTFYLLSQNKLFCQKCNLNMFYYEYNQFLLIDIDKKEKEIKVKDKLFEIKNKYESCHKCGNKCKIEIKFEEFPQILIVVIKSKNDEKFFLKNNFKIIENKQFLYSLHCIIEKNTNNFYFLNKSNWYKFDITTNEQIVSDKNIQDINPSVLFFAAKFSQQKYQNSNQINNSMMLNYNNNMQMNFNINNNVINNNSSMMNMKNKINFNNINNINDPNIMNNMNNINSMNNQLVNNNEVNMNNINSTNNQTNVNNNINNMNFQMNMPNLNNSFNQMNMNNLNNNLINFNNMNNINNQMNFNNMNNQFIFNNINNQMGFNMNNQMNFNNMNNKINFNNSNNFNNQIGFNINNLQNNIALNNNNINTNNTTNNNNINNKNQNQQILEGNIIFVSFTFIKNRKQIYIDVNENETFENAIKLLDKKYTWFPLTENKIYFFKDKQITNYKMTLKNLGIEDSSDVTIKCD